MLVGVGSRNGETFILFNKQIKGNKRELILLGVPIFGHIIEEPTSNNQTINIEPISDLLQGVIKHLVQWQLILEYKKPNGCIINFFDEGGFSQAGNCMTRSRHGLLMWHDSMGLTELHSSPTLP